MVTSMSERMRNWHGPLVLSFGFRPFFLFAGIWATLGMALWVLMLTGHAALPVALSPFDWHAHEFVFGYTSAVIAGFVLTAVPNWTGRLPVIGWPLAALSALWIVGRLAILVSAWMPWWLVMVADLALLVVFAGVIAREVVAGRNWRNLPVAGLVGLLALANAAFHIEAAMGHRAAEGYGLRFALGVIIMLISLIGGRIIPSFTRNWLAQRKITELPVPFSRPDAAILVLNGVALILFVLAPNTVVTGALLVIAGFAHLWRQSRWQPLATGPEPLLWVLHLAYLLLSLGFIAAGAGAIGLLPQAAALHVWMAGTIGLMTLAVMGRAALGHTGRPLHAGGWLTACYLALTASVVVRLAAGFVPGTMGLLHLAAVLWIGAFGGFSILFWPVLTGPRLAKKAVSGKARAV